MSRLIDLVKEGGGLTLTALAAVSWLFGVEPQIMHPYRGPLESVSLGDYVAGAVERNGDSLLTVATAYVAYPGAVVGKEIHDRVTVPLMERSQEYSTGAEKEK